MLKINFISTKSRPGEALVRSATHIQSMLNTGIRRLKLATSSLLKSTQVQNSKEIKEERFYYPDYPIKNTDELVMIQKERGRGKVVRIPPYHVEDEKLVSEFQDERFTGYTAAVCDCGVTANVVHRPMTMWKCKCKRYNSLCSNAQVPHENPTIGPRLAEIDRASKLAKIINNLKGQS
ncbi:MAG: hypothetical protein KAS32_26895 [Candidatus Peribacteraceae bacterium]|nr:hypothetical protein [Candidatus Peribacteraceae bacterium]